MLNQSKLNFPLKAMSSFSHPSTSRENFIQSLDHEVSKDVILLLKMFQGMVNFEKKFNKKKGRSMIRR
jgi:hypothetical protein